MSGERDPLKYANCWEHAALLVDHGTNAVNFLFRELSDPLIDANSCLSQYLVGARAPDPIYVCQTDFSSFISWQVHTCYACHSSSDSSKSEASSVLPLSLFVLRVGANHPHYPTAVDNLAVIAHFLYRCPDFHSCSSLP